MPKAVPTITHRIPFLCIDCRWKVFSKWLWDDYAGPNETYSGYINYWDEIPWQRVVHDDEIERDHNYAAQAQYIPTYSGDIIGFVDDLGKLLHKDGILYDEINAQYSHEFPAGLVQIKKILYRDFDTHAPVCPVVYSRPVTHTFKGSGHIGDNSMISRYISAPECCDGTSTGSGMFPHEFLADALHFVREISGDEIMELLRPFAEANGNEGGAESSLPSALADGRLVVYTIGTGSVPRIKINGGDWHVVSSGYFPPYGDPYNFDYHAHRAVIEDHGLIFGESEPVRGDGGTEPIPIPMNEIIVELIAPRPEDLGAQVVFAFEYEEIVKPKPRRKKMAGPRKGRALGDFTRRWDIMLTALKDILAQMPQFQTYHDQLEQMLEDLESKDTEQEMLKGQLKTLTAEIEKIMADGEKMYSTIKKMLELEYGTGAPEIAKFVPQASYEVDKTKEGFGDDEEKPPEEPIP